MNIVTITGRICKDPELRRTNEGTACCSFTLAVKRPKVKDITDFHDFVVWQQGAEYLCQYGHKGDIVCVSGSLTTREWTDKDGNKRKSTEVRCDSVELISSKKSEGNNQPAQTQAQPSYAQQGSYGDSANNNYQQSFRPVDIPDAQLPF